MNISERIQTALARYIAASKELHMNGATKANLEESRSYAVEALTAILIDNAEETGYADYIAWLRSVRQRKQVTA